MAWFKVDDSILDHPKFVALLADPELAPLEGMAAAWLWLEANAWCERHLTDGIVDMAWACTSMMRRLKRQRAEALACTLLDSLARAKAGREHGLMEPLDGGRWRIHDYHDWHLSREQRQALRTTRSAAGQKGGKARAEKEKAPPPAPAEQANAQALASRGVQALASDSQAERSKTDTPLPPVALASTNGRPTYPPEAWNTDCPPSAGADGRVRRWGLGACVNAAYFDAHPDSGLPTRGHDGQPHVRPKQCPAHRQLDTPAW